MNRELELCEREDVVIQLLPQFRKVLLPFKMSSILWVMTFVFLFGSAVVAQAQLRNGDQVCTEGYIMDSYCIQLGYMLDNGLDPLRFPEEHTVHCLVDVGICRNSGFVVLIDPVEGEDEYTQGYRLDSDGTEAITQLARAVGSCSTCYPSGTLVNGMRAGIMGTVVDASSVPPLITVEKASYIEPGEDYCPEVPPTRSPSLAPSASPTAAPAAFPSAAPSISPTAAPFDVPSAPPSASPSDAPIASPSAPPSALPTTAPTPSPTKAPSASPTKAPTAAPTAVPSVAPTTAPTAFTTEAPSTSPTAMPATSPSAVFSVSESDFPSIVPSDSPSMMPSDVPSMLPSDNPSLAPSDAPSMMPSDVPSMVP